MLLRLGLSALAGTLVLALSISVGNGPTVLRFQALAVLFLNLWMVFSWRRNAGALVIAGLMSYFNYSVLIAEYLLPAEGLQAVFTEARDAATLATAIACMLALTTMLAALPAPPPTRTLEWGPRGDVAIYAVSVAALLYVGLFEIDRSGISGKYEVRISPAYEYSFLILIVALVAAGKVRSRRLMLFSVVALLIVQDAYFGGRVTSVQLLVTVALMAFPSRVNLRTLGALGVAAVLAGTAVGTLRSQQQRGVSLGELVSRLRDGLFVSDTAVYAFYASLTHIRASMRMGEEEVRTLVGAALRQTFLGGESKLLLTQYVSDNYYTNAGGGYYYTHAYALGGYAVVILGGLALCALLLAAWTKEGSRDYFGYVGLIVAVTASRWYLYSPTSLFRSLLVFSVAYAGLVVWRRSTNASNVRVSRKPRSPAL